MKSRFAAGAFSWIGSFVLSLLFIWLVSSFFLNSVTPASWDDVLKVYVRKPGSTVHWRSEGWADIPVGAMGMDANDAAILQSGAPCYVLWGDSFVDAFQVPSHARGSALFNAGSQELKVISVGGGGLNVADYFFRIPRLQQSFSNIKGNVILLCGMEDVLPGKHVDCHSRFLSDPWRFEESLCLPSGLALKYTPFVHEYRLAFLHSVYRQLKDYHFRFEWGPQAAIARQPSSVGAGLGQDEEAWEYLLSALTEVGSGPLAFVYVPLTPQLRGNSILIHDPDASLMHRFKNMCEKRGVLFVDLTDRFNALYREQGVFPRGFFNTPPSSGHLNENGHRLVAEALERVVEEWK